MRRNGKKLNKKERQLVKRQQYAKKQRIIVIERKRQEIIETLSEELDDPNEEPNVTTNVTGNVPEEWYVKEDGSWVLARNERKQLARERRRTAMQRSRARYAKRKA
jgi:hypothetical protein